MNTLRLINDHTEGMGKGRPSPFAHVADNDLSVGLFLEYLSNSPVWKESAVFIIEDDAQNGPDHVDAHRARKLCETRDGIFDLGLRHEHQVRQLVHDDHNVRHRIRDRIAVVHRGDGWWWRGGI